MKDFDKFAERLASNLKLRYHSVEDIRVFNRNGHELFAADLPYLFDGEILYVSVKEDFNMLSYYSEYEVLTTLGAGGFATVMLGTHKVTGVKVAIKITNPNAIDNVQDLDALFSEGETLKGLNHPNIVKMLNCFVIKKTMQAYFIMEYLGGGELFEYMQEKGRFDETEARDIFKQILSAVDYCHRQKIIHRDLKPENILRESKESKVFKVSYL